MNDAEPVISLRSDPATASTRRVDHERPWTKWFPFAIVAAGYGLLLVFARVEWGTPLSGIFVGIVVLMAVVVARQIFLLRDNDRLVVEARAEIAERVQTEATLSTLRRQLESILDAAAEGIFGVDAGGRITFINPSAARAFGWPPAAALGRDALSLIGHASPDRVKFDASTSQVILAIRDREAHSSVGDYFQRSDGTSFPIEYVSTPIREDGDVVGAVVTFSDITHRVNAEVEQRQSQKLEAVGRLAAGIAHEMNTPIQYVGDNTRFLRDSLDPLFRVLKNYAALRLEVERGGPLVSERLEAVRAAEQEADLEYLTSEFPKAFDQTLEGISRVASIVRALKDFAHPDAKEQMPADLNGALRTTLIVARDELKYIGAVETELNPLPPVQCYLGELNQVFLNLLVNAAHAIADAGRSGRGVIRVRTTCDDGHVVVAISDNGCGISDAIQAKIYEPFFTTKAVGRGTGQGLAIARSIVVDKHQGNLTCESRVGVGTTFSVRLPVAGRLMEESPRAA